MTDFFLALAVGTMLGILAGLGTGGGSLLILWLTLVLGMAPQDARVVNLLFFLPSAVISSLMRIRRGSLPVRKVLPAIVSGCVIAGIFAFLSAGWDIRLLRKLFGGLLLFTGVRELMYKPKRKGPA